MTVPPQQLVAAILRSDLYSFIRAIFPIVSPGSAFLPNWHIEAMAFQLTRVLRGECKRLIIMVPPRNLKSICASVAFPAFALGQDPTRRIICISYAEALARKHANDCRAVMHSSLYKRLFPKTGISGKKDTELEFATSLGGSRLATSVGGTVTGRGGSLIIIDDPMKSQDAMSETVRESINHWIGHTLLSRLDNKTKDSIILVMQRLHVDDLAGHLLQQGGWEFLQLPAIAPWEEPYKLGPERYHLHREGEALHPAHEPLCVLQELKRALGSMTFSAQYLQDPVPEGGNLVKWHWFRFHDSSSPRTSNDRIIVSWDTALSARELASFSACVVLQARGETVWVLDVFRERLEYPDLKRKVIELHQRWRHAANDYALLIENKGSGMSLIQDLRGQNIHAVAVDPQGDKVMRMNQQTARIEAGAVSLPKQAPWLGEFRRELMAFPAAHHTDQVDAFSQALNRVYNREGGEHSWGTLRY
jgi:predicted phage terminase large subunit-like protein